MSNYKIYRKKNKYVIINNSNVVVVITSQYNIAKLYFGK